MLPQLAKRTPDCRKAAYNARHFYDAGDIGQRRF
jgi:hypothetical protein